MAEPLPPKPFKPEDYRPVKDKAGLNSPKISADKRSKNKRESEIPKYVANRMARRIAITTGLPTISGMGIFIGSYYVVSRGIAEIAPGVTLLTSAGCFLLGLIGLSYGILSSSWEKEPGSLLGLENIKTNIQRVRDAFKPQNNHKNKS